MFVGFWSRWETAVKCKRRKRDLQKLFLKDRWWPNPTTSIVYHSIDKFLLWNFQQTLKLYKIHNKKAKIMNNLLYANCTTTRIVISINFLNLIRFSDIWKESPSHLFDLRTFKRFHHKSNLISFRSFKI